MYRQTVAFLSEPGLKKGTKLGIVTAIETLSLSKNFFPKYRKVRYICDLGFDLGLEDGKPITIRRRACLFLSVLPLILPVEAALSRGPRSDLTKLSLEELNNIEVTVTSVSKRKERLTEAPSAVYVLSQEDFRRSGASSIPEALRMVPGLHVA